MTFKLLSTVVLGVALMGMVGCDDDDDATGTGGEGGDVTVDTGVGGEGGSGGTAGEGGEGGDDGTAGMGGEGGMVGPGFGSEADVAMAADLWAELADHQSWEQPTTDGDENGFREGRVPHGAWQKLYHNGDDNTADGYVIVKANYGPSDTAPEDGAMIGAYTVMKKMDGYDPDNNDWFYAKFMADGTLEEAMDMPMAGRVGVNGGACIGCHSQAPGDNFLFLF